MDLRSSNLTDTILSPQITTLEDIETLRLDRLNFYPYNYASPELRNFMLNYQNLLKIKNQISTVQTKLKVQYSNYWHYADVLGLNPNHDDWISFASKRYPIANAIAYNLALFEGLQHTAQRLQTALTTNYIAFDIDQRIT